MYFGGIGLSRSLTATAKTAEGAVVSGATISWTSSDQNVATVTSTGAVTAAGVGTAQISATSGTGSASAKVVVEQVLAGLKVTPGTLTLDSLGAVAQATAAVVDSGGTAIPGDEEVEWSVADPDIAQVTSDGLVRARAPGSTSLSAIQSVGTLSGSATLNVTIPALAGVVDTQGGSVTSSDGEASLTVPAGAVGTSVAISAQSASPTNTDKLVSGTAVTLGPTGVTFSTPADLTLSYQPASLAPGTDPLSLGLYRLDNNTWTEAGEVAVDTTAHSVVGQVTTLGTYALRSGRMGDPTGLWSATETTTADGCYGEAGNVEQISVWAEMKGDVLTIEHGGETVSGKVVGNVFGWTANYTEDGANVVETYSITIARSGSSATGSGHYVATGPVNCEIKTQVTATRISRDKPVSQASIDSVTLHYTDNPNQVNRAWRPDTGESASVIAEAYSGGAKIPGAQVSLWFTEERVLDDQPSGTIIQTDQAFHLAPGLVGSTELKAISLVGSGKVVNSAPLTLTLVRDTTFVHLLAPTSHNLGAGIMAFPDGLLLDYSPLLVWKDANAEVTHWELYTGNGEGLPLRLTRTNSETTGCTVDAQWCSDWARDLWTKTKTVTLLQIRGLNALDNVVSKGGFPFVQVFDNSITVQYNAATPFIQVAGKGDSPTGFEDLNKYPKTQHGYCPSQPSSPCLDAFFLPYSHDEFIVSGRLPSGEFMYARIDLPRDIWENPDASSPVGNVQGRWDCSYANVPYEQQTQVRFYKGDEQNEARSYNLESDPVQSDCSGTIGFHWDEYKDLRGTWRIFTVDGSGTLKNPLGLSNMQFQVRGAVKWEDGAVSPPTHWWAPPGGTSPPTPR